MISGPMRPAPDLSSSVLGKVARPMVGMSREELSEKAQFSLHCGAAYNAMIKPPPSPLPQQVPDLLGRAQIFTSEALSSPGLSLSSVSIFCGEGVWGASLDSPPSHLEVWGGHG